MRHFERDINLIGSIYGPIWEGSECSKQVCVPMQSVAFGTGRHAETDANEQILTVTERRRRVPVTQFPSIDEFVGEMDSCDFADSY